MVGAYLKYRTPRKRLKMETPFTMLHDEEADLLHLRLIRTRIFVYINDSRKLVTAVWGRKVCGYSKESKSYRVWN